MRNTRNTSLPSTPFHSLTGALLLAGLGLLSSNVYATENEGGRDLFIRSAVENPTEDTVNLPLYRGRSQGQTVWYVVLDASTGTAAEKYGVNRADKLKNARGTAAVQKVRLVDGLIEFPATVDFRPERLVVPGPSGFPPLAVQPGAVGQPGYSPLIELPDGTILNAPHLANDSGQADKVVALDTGARSVTYKETEGYANGKEVYYVSTDASGFTAAALEGVTFAPQLDAAPFLGGDGSKSARAALAAFVNGQTGADNPERQGLNSALLDGLDPLNVIAWTPNQGRYSPLWDVHLAMWSDAAVTDGLNVMQEDFGDILGLARKGLVTAPGGAKFGPAGFIVNCPVVSRVR
ncbi:hypothetical protein ABZN20_11670 [Methylococcus sp. ANG]|uniref:DUF7482 domain-containing protein n=1 Tax=Methylococcus sp. ANG TaxID=3231903 RepID=UPI0034579961